MHPRLRDGVSIGTFTYPQFPEPIVKAFLRDPTLLAKLPFCQAAVITFLNEHCPGLRPVFIPHCQHICHL